MKNRIYKEFIEAFKNKEMLKKNLLGDIKTKINLLEKEKNNIEDQDILKILKSKLKEINKTIETIKDKSNNLYIQAEQEIKILKEYLPENYKENEVKDMIKLEIEKQNITKNDFWKIMWIMIKKLEGRFDNNKLKELINKELS